MIELESCKKKFYKLVNFLSICSNKTENAFQPTMQRPNWLFKERTQVVYNGPVSTE